MKLRDIKEFLACKVMRYLVMIPLAALYALAVACVIDPNNLAPGGVTGVAIILNRIINVETGTLILVLNIPILLLSLWKFGFHFTMDSLYVLFWVSTFTNMASHLPTLTKNPILAAVTGGSLCAVALGAILRTGATTGGLDIIVKVLRIKYPHLKTGTLFLMLDLLIVIASAAVVESMDHVICAGIAVFVTASLLDVVLYGRDEAKLIFVVSDQSQRIAQLLMEQNIGVTYLEGSGAYTKKHKNIILCVVRKAKSVKVEEIVRTTDRSAFMILSSASEIYGEGYKDYSEGLL